MQYLLAAVLVIGVPLACLALLLWLARLEDTLPRDIARAAARRQEAVEPIRVIEAGSTPTGTQADGTGAPVTSRSTSRSTSAA